MKTNFKRIGKQSISIVLAVMMMLSTMLVGMVTSNAADTWYVIGHDYDTTWNTNGRTSPMSYDSTTGYYYIDKKLTSTSGDHYFRLHNGSNEYGPTTTNNDISISSYNTKFDAVKDSTANAFKYSCDSLNYRLWFDATNKKIWITDNNAEPTDSTYYICGAVELTGYEWGSNADAIAANKLEYDSATSTYSKTYTNIPKGDYEFKVRDAQNPNSWFGHSIYSNNLTTKGCCSVSNDNDNIKLSLTDTCDVTISISSDNQKMKVTASKDVQTYTITTETPENGTIKVSADSLAAGETFTVEATPNADYELVAITVKDAEGNTVEPTDASTHTYTMPANNVTVSATFKVKTDVKYSVTYTDPTGSKGVVSATINPTKDALAAGLTAGTNVTVTVTVESGYTASLDVAGATVEKVIDGNTYTFKFSMPAQNITVAPQVTKAEENTGTLIPDRYLIYSDSSSNPSNFTNYLNLYRDANNQVYAYFDESKFDDSKTYYFMISNSVGKSTSWEYAYDHYNNSEAFANESNKKYLDCGKNDHWLPKEGSSSSVHVFFARFSVLPTYVGTISSVKINLGYYNGTDIVESSTDSTTKATTYEVIPTSGAEGMVQVFAKDGTIRKQIVNNELVNFQKYADMADTVLTAENTADLTKYNNKNDYYETAYAKVGTKLKIKTTILPDYRDKYFVKAFSINGYSYGIIDASQANKQTGEYTCEYTIPEDFEGKRIEITPIYYYIEEKDTVTFYVEGFDGKVQEMWGNTIAVQAWYKNGVEGGESGSDTKNALGGYPGQPLVYQGGKYSMQIPKCLNGVTANTVQGITLNNYFFDDIHKQSFTDQNDKYNCQTYDFNDFYKLSETPDVDNIIFDFRYRTTTDNDPKDNLTNSTYNSDELEPLKDYYGNIVNIFGNILSEDWKEDYNSNYLTVISNGYKNNDNIGKYATEWSVYDHEGKYITTINCSSLINENKVDTDDYTVAYNKLKQYKDLPVQIAYEMSLYGGGDKGTRADGRWYFSKKAHTISANVQIEYGTNVNSEFNVDEFETNSNVGKNTGAKAYFTNAGSIGKTTCDGTVDGGNFSVHAETDANAKYYFLGWYLKTSDGYSFITNESDADFPMTNNETYVARFINTPSGTLTLSHTLLDNSADGKTFIKADIVDSEGNVIKPFEETSGNIVIPSSYVNYTSDYKIVATLRTEPYGKDTVEGFYNSYKERYTDVEAGENTCVKSTTIKDLFDPSSYELIKSNIPFYSNIKSNPINYQITYVYFTRLDDQQIYVIKDTLSGIELEEMWAANEAAGLNKEQLSKAFITKKAPFVSNYREEITWDMDHANIDRDYTATVFSNTKTVNPKISALTVAGSWTAPAPVEYGELALSSDGDYLYKTGTNDFPAQYDYNGTTKYDFSFWAIFDNPDAAQKYSDAVAKYMSENPDPDMSERLTKLTNLEGYKNLITKSYSKKYNYVSYQDYYIVPVYAGRFAKEQIKESQVSIRLLEYTRNQWTDDTHGVNGNGIKNEGGSKTDYLYTDFALSFDKNQLLIQNNPDIKVGVAFEIVARYDDVKPLDSSYKIDSNEAEIGKLVKEATESNKPKGKVGAYTINDKSRSVYRYEIDNTKISEKNRIEYYLRFNNTNNAQQNVMKVYSYIYDTQTKQIYLSAPEYMNMYDIGNLTYITSGLASNDLQPATEIG